MFKERKKEGSRRREGQADWAKLTQKTRKVPVIKNKC